MTNSTRPEERLELPAEGAEAASRVGLSARERLIPDAQVVANIDHLNAKLEVDGDATLLRMTGALDIAAVPELIALVHRAVERPRMRELVLDLGAVDFIDSTGIGSLVQARNQCRDSGAELRLAEVGPRVFRVLQITGMTQTFGLTR